MKKAIIIGIKGMDGSFMKELLLSKGYEVYGGRKKVSNNSIKDWSEFIDNIRPDEIYNFAAYSNVFDPYENLDMIFYTNSLLPHTILKSIFKVDKSIKFFQASSRLIFGNNSSEVDLYPYSMSKIIADNRVKHFRENHDMYCCSGIFFNHESERRPIEFFSQKIVHAAVSAYLGNIEKIEVGNLDSLRDIGYAKDYVEAAYLMMQNEKPKDYVIGTGKLISMREFTKKCFDNIALDYRDFIIENKNYRKDDVDSPAADISDIKNDLGWMPSHSVDDIIKIMMGYRFKKIEEYEKTI